MDSNQIKKLVKIFCAIIASMSYIKIQFTVSDYLIKRSRAKNYFFTADRTDENSFIFLPCKGNKKECIILGNKAFTIHDTENNIVMPKPVSTSLLESFAEHNFFSVSINNAKKLVYIFISDYEQLPTHIYLLRNSIDSRADLLLPQDMLSKHYIVDRQSIDIFIILSIGGFLYDHQMVFSENLFYTIYDSEVGFYFPLNEEEKAYFISRLPIIVSSKINGVDCFMVQFLNRDTIQLNLYDKKKSTVYFKGNKIFPIYEIIDDFFDADMVELREYYTNIDFDKGPILKLPTMASKFLMSEKFNKFDEYVPQ